MNNFNEKHFGKFEITIRTAKLDDISNLMQLNQKWYFKNLTSLENGFLSVIYDSKFFTDAINKGDVLVFEHVDLKIGGYVLVNTVMKTEQLTLVQEAYSNLKPDMQSKKIAYGAQIVLDSELQGSFFIVIAQKAYVKFFKTRYDVLITTVSKQNQRACRINIKLGINLLEFNKDYYIGELVL